MIVSTPGAGGAQALAGEVAREAGDDLRVISVLTVLDTSTFAQDVTSQNLIHDRGIPTAAEDGWAIAEVLVRQVEYAKRRDPPRRRARGGEGRGWRRP